MSGSSFASQSHSSFCNQRYQVWLKEEVRHGARHMTSCTVRSLSQPSQMSTFPPHRQRWEVYSLQEVKLPRMQAQGHRNSEYQEPHIEVPNTALADSPAKQNDPRGRISQWFPHRESQPAALVRSSVKLTFSKLTPLDRATSLLYQ